MFERLSYLYSVGRLTDIQLEVAVSKTWITKEEKQQIIDAVVTQ